MVPLELSAGSIGYRKWFCGLSGRCSSLSVISGRYRSRFCIERRQDALKSNYPYDPAMETLAERIERVLRDEISIVPYDPNWPKMFAEERAHLLASLPREMIGRIEHFGSTAIPGLAAKPIVDMLIEVRSLEETKSRIVPILESQGYDYFWRPTSGDDVPPFYAWFIKRDAAGARTHHVHMVESDFEHWERLLFRNYLIEHPEAAKEYEALKFRLAHDYANDRVAYTKCKTDYVLRVTQIAKEYYTRK